MTGPASFILRLPSAKTTRASAKRYDLPFLQFVDTKGEMTKETDWAGVFCKEADKLIMKDLEDKGLLYKKMDYEHSYPYCWRCDTPLIYYARSSWFIKMTAVKDQLIKNNRSVNWLPENIKEGRMGNFLENVRGLGLIPGALLGNAAACLGVQMRSYPRNRKRAGA